MFDQKACEGKLLLLQFSRVERGIKTKLGPADACRMSLIVDLSSGQTWRESMIWGKALVNQFDGMEPGKFSVGRLAKGEPLQPGQSPPWVWIVGDDADRSVAERYLAQAAPTPPPAPTYQPQTQTYAPPATPAPAMAGATAPPPWATS
jgi:hypothetical protein